ncbi:Lrp/AsnC ligand binding domain-containing protein [Streptomyces sp. SCA3-4]|uniref:Lrp/AsnC ligand binding domain-containing protein n=1 Tax=Streptomyces sichuanensis TaxID=2871810 RepID=UPI001CE2E48A|nr:Lrp/AsnC ligand binding domain-containing protein [Streptomyces sichuanensis]MCA6091891.1 Lrp/AsnC ligand binding domain-containing protein [Streptomyces sichuanensis]
MRRRLTAIALTLGTAALPLTTAGPTTPDFTTTAAASARDVIEIRSEKHDKCLASNGDNVKTCASAHAPIGRPGGSRTSDRPRKQGPRREGEAPGPRRGLLYLAFAAATTGPHNLVATGVFRGGHDLHHYLDHRIGSLPGIQAVETAPILREVKRLAVGP